GDVIMREELKEWMEECLIGDNPLQIISWNELYPLYDIFDETLCKKVKSTLGIDEQTENSGIREKVLMTGAIPIEVSEYYYRVNFSSKLNSINYQIFGKLMTEDGNPIDKAIVKFEYMDIHGFSVRIKNFNLDSIRQSTDPRITWLMIGNPIEIIGHYSQKTRIITVLSLDNTSRTNLTKRDIQLNIPKNLPEKSILITSVIYSLSNYEPNFVTTIQKYDYDKINIIICDSNDSDDDEEEHLNKLEYSIQWCILQIPDEQEFRDESGSIVTTTHLMAM
ncbi:13662_t:CDS:2, partial [Cetraspora pellucida]